jgi:regulator of protease activity HflC (stomatin/prohibitin superfamily)
MELIESIFGFIFSWKVVLLVVFIWLASSSVFIIRGKTAGILETFGKPHERARLPGLQFKLPFPFTSIRAHVNLQQQEIGADVSVKTNDNAFMTLPVKVQYRASDDPLGAVKAHYELEKPETQIASYVLNNVRQTASGMEMVELYANRDAMESKVQEALREQFARYGYIIENVLVDEPQPSPEVRDAFNKVIASKRLKEAAENEAEAAKIRLVGVAKAEAESKKLQGQGMADMREAIARGLEHAMETMQKAGLTPEDAMSFLNETNRLDTISTAAAHGNMIIVDTRGGNNIVDTIGAVKAADAKPRLVGTAGAA